MRENEYSLTSFKWLLEVAKSTGKKTNWHTAVVVVRMEVTDALQTQYSYSPSCSETEKWMQTGNGVKVVPFEKCQLQC